MLNINSSKTYPVKYSGEIQIEITVGDRKRIVTTEHRELVRKLFAEELRRIGILCDFSLSLDKLVDRFPITGSEIKECRYVIKLNTDDVKKVAIKIASRLRAWPSLLGNIVIRMREGRIVLIAPCSKRSRQIRSHSQPLSKPVLIVIDESIELCELEPKQSITNAA